MKITFFSKLTIFFQGHEEEVQNPVYAATTSNAPTENVYDLANDSTGNNPTGKRL